MASTVPFTDVTNTTIQIVAEEYAAIILNMSDEQRRYVKVFADTIRNPHEVFRLWRRNPNISGHWLLIRAYLQVLDLSETDTPTPFAISLVELAWENRWKIYNMEMMLGEKTQITEQINSTVRFGERLFSKS